MLNTAPINWGTKLQKTVTLSSTKAEYMALKSATLEAVYLRNILLYLSEKLKFKVQNNFITILVDNLNAKDLSKNPTHHNRSKHIDIAYYYTRECIQSGLTKVVHIPDKLNVADILTKGVATSKIHWFLQEI